MKPIWYPLFVVAVLSLAVLIAVRSWPWGNESYDTGLDFWLPLVFGAFITCICVGGACGAAYGVSAWIGGDADTVWQKGWGAKMVSMRSADGEHGSIVGGIFMISGYLDQSQTYFYYTLNSDSSLQPGKWRPDGDTSIFQEQRDDGYVQQYTLAFARPWVSWFGTPDGRVKMEFHIPAGSLKQQFKLQ
jgi:hypothetical protein